jgi:uncharacterized protein (DUF302 family)
MNTGLIHLPSAHSAADTLARLGQIVEARGLRIMARIDHSAEAARVGLSLRPTCLLLFGHPKSGTPIMVAAPASALDLPLKALVWQDEQGRAWLSYNSPSFLADRHGLADTLVSNIAGIVDICEQARSA